MLEQPAEAYAGKVSQEFAARLEHLSPDETIRAIVLPYVTNIPSNGSDHTDHTQRSNAKAATENALLRLFRTIDALFADSMGRRLTDKPNALGFVVVETTRSGIAKLAQLAGVRAVLEDQPVFPIRTQPDKQARHWS